VDYKGGVKKIKRCRGVRKEGISQADKNHESLGFGDKLEYRF
jgi:hypothetical protein